MIKKERSLVSKNSNPFNAMIKNTSVALSTTAWKRISTIFIAIILLSSVVTFNFGYFEAEAKKPDGSGGTQNVVSWSNGFPSGNHTNVNIHGKKLSFNCDNDGKGKGADFGKSVFVPLNTTAARDANQAPTEILNATIGDINFVSNKRSNIENGIVRDPCSAPFGNVTAPSTGDNKTAALVELPPGEHQVYWRILGNPFTGHGPDKGNATAMITNPALLDQCNFLPANFTDGTTVQSFDPDVGLDLVPFVSPENHTIAGAFLNTSSIFNDTDTSGNVTGGDDRLYGDDFIAIGTDLFNFTALEKHEDTGLTVGFFDSGETIYLDSDDSGNVTDGDTRLANAASQGLPDDVGGDEISCIDESLIGLGLVSNKGSFLLDNGTLVRFGDDDNTNEKGNPEKAKKTGKSVAINMTKLFVWTGSVCDAAGLDGNDDNKFTFSDFDLVNQTGHLDPDGNITSVDLQFLNDTLGFFINSTTITDAEAIEGTGVDNDGIDSQAEFDVWIDLALASLEDLEGNLLCRSFIDEWVFNVADIVLFGFDYENKGSSLTQLRFYPVETTSFTSEE